VRFSIVRSNRLACAGISDRAPCKACIRRHSRTAFSGSRAGASGVIGRTASRPSRNQMCGPEPWLNRLFESDNSGKYFRRSNKLNIGGRARLVSRFAPLAFDFSRVLRFGKTVRRERYNAKRRVAVSAGRNTRKIAARTDLGNRAKGASPTQIPQSQITPSTHATAQCDEILWPANRS